MVSLNSFTKNVWRRSWLSKASPYDAQRQIPLTYKGRKLRHTFVPDVICYDKIILELKAVSDLTNEHRSQIINYLKATGMKLGLLINFGAKGGVVIERFVN